MKQLSKALIAYVTVVQGQPLPRGRNMADLKLIASNANVAESIKAGLATKDSTYQYTTYTIQLLKLILMAAVHSSKNAQYIGAMMTLSTESQASLKSIIEDVQVISGVGSHTSAEIHQIQKRTYTTWEADGLDNDVVHSPLAPPADQQLIYEGRHGRAGAESDKLTIQRRNQQKELEDLHSRLARLKQNNVCWLYIICINPLT